MILSFNILHFLKVLLIEIAYCLAIFFGYTFFSFFAFGEGNNSFMYTPANTLIDLALIFIPPLGFNIYKFIKSRSIDAFKAKNYLLVQMVIIALLIWSVFTFHVFGPYDV